MTFVPGKSGNPAGRPKMPPELLQQIKDACPAAIEKIIKIANGKDPDLALKACEVLLNRAWGKPAQAVDLDANVKGGFTVVFSTPTKIG